MNTSPDQPQPSLRFPRSRRLRSTHDFRRVFAARLSAADNHLILYACPHDHPSPSRAGFVVSRKYGPAVRRNASKRALREAFRTLQHELPGPWDYVIIPRPSSEPSVTTYRHSLLQLARRLHHRLRRQNQQ